METDEFLPEIKVERKTEELVKPGKIIYPFAKMDSDEVCMFATQSTGVEMLLRADAFSEQTKFAFSKKANRNIGGLYDEKDARSTFAIEYLEKLIQVAKICGAKQVTLTLRSDFPLMMEFESKDKTVLHDQTLRTALIISPIVDCKIDH